MGDVEWRDTSDFLPTWSPIKGPKVEGQEKRETLKPGDDSWIEGYYLGSREVEIEGDTMIVHKIRATKCGNTEHLSKGEISPEGTDVEFFGTGVINAKLKDDIQPGQYCKILWLGVVPKSEKIKRAYHNWKLFEATSVAPLQMQGGVVVGDNSSSDISIDEPDDEPAVTTETSEAKEEPATKAAPAAEEEDDDDLPF